MVTRGNVNTARITRYRSYEAMIGEGEEGGCYCVMINRFLLTLIPHHRRKILTHLHPGVKASTQRVESVMVPRLVVPLPE